MKKTTLQRVLKAFAKTSGIFMLMLICIAALTSLRIILELLFGVKMAAIVVFALMFVCIFVLNFLKG